MTEAVVRFLCSAALAFLFQSGVEWAAPTDASRFALILSGFVAAIVWYPLDGLIRKKG